MAAAAALAAPSLIPSSLFFSADAPPSLSSSASLSVGLRYHKRFLSVSSSSCWANRNRVRGLSPRRRRSVVVFAAASGSSSGDYYATLGVPKSANIKEIKSAYRRLARQVSGFPATTDTMMHR